MTFERLPLKQLTPRQMVALDCAARGMTAEEIALKLGVSSSWINKLLDGVRGEFGYASRPQLAYNYGIAVAWAGWEQAICQARKEKAVATARRLVRAAMDSTTPMFLRVYARDALEKLCPDGADAIEDLLKVTDRQVAA